MRPGALRFAICHTVAASSQPQNTCPAISTPPQMSHSTSNGILRSLSLVLVGRISLQACQMKFFILFGQRSCQIDFHSDVILVLLEHSPTSTLVSFLWLIWYALRTQKTPLAIANHTLWSTGNAKFKGIAKMDLASWGRKIELTSSDFHTALSLSIRVETFSLYNRGFMGVVIL